MNTSISFWAQSLDNTSPDHIEKNGAILNPNDQIDQNARQEFVNRVSQVMTQGQVMVTGVDVTLFVHEASFVLKVVPPKRDTAQRRAPIVCHGTIPEIISDNWAEEVVYDLKRFTERIGRSIPPSLQSEIERAVSVIQKKSTYQSRVSLDPVVVIALLVGLIVVACVVLWLLRRILFRNL